MATGRADLDLQPLDRGRADRTAVVWATVGLVVLVVVLYARTFGYGLYLDDYALARPWTFREVSGVFRGEFDTAGFNDAYFRPFASVSFALEWPVWGTRSWGYHLTNLALHAGATIGVFALLRRVRIPWWSALIGAVFFSAVPSNVATVVYIAERTDAMVAIFVLLGLLVLHRYGRSPRTSSLVVLNVLFVLALLSKEVAVAMIPMVAAYWLYLRTEALDDTADAPGGTAVDARTSVVGHWRAELGRYWSAIVRRDGRRDWLVILGPMIGVLAVYLVYRQAVLPPGSLGGRFAETQNPVSSLIGGINSTFKGVPWEVRAWSLVPLAAIFVLAFVLAPRARAWRVVLLGAAFVVGGVLPLSFSGGVEPRLLYVAEIGMAAALAGVASIYGQILRPAPADRSDRAARSAPTTAVRAAVAILAACLVATTLVGLVQAQDVFREGSAEKLDADQRVYEDPTLRGYVEPVHLQAIEQRLVEAGRIDPP